MVIKRMSKTQEEKDYLNFGDYVRNTIGMQCQYAYRYLHGVNGNPALGKDLRTKRMDTGSYHDILIHKDDAPIFRQRLEDHRKQNGGWF